MRAVCLDGPKQLVKEVDMQRLTGKVLVKVSDVYLRFRYSSLEQGQRIGLIMGHEFADSSRCRSSQGFSR